MSEETYTGETVAPDDYLETSIINKIHRNTQAARERIDFHGAEVTITVQLNAPRTVQQSQDFEDDAEDVWEIPFDTVLTDTDQIFQTSPYPRFVVPGGFTRAELALWLKHADGDWAIQIWKNRTDLIGAKKNGNNTNRKENSVCTAPTVAVNQGDFFTAKFNVNGTGTQDFDDEFSNGFGGSLVTIVDTPIDSRFMIRLIK